MNAIQKSLTGFKLQTENISRKRVKQIEKKAQIQQALNKASRPAIIEYNNAIKEY